MLVLKTGGFNWVNPLVDYGNAAFGNCVTSGAILIGIKAGTGAFEHFGIGADDGAAEVAIATDLGV